MPAMLVSPPCLRVELHQSHRPRQSLRKGEPGPVLPQGLFLKSAQPFLGRGVLHADLWKKLLLFVLEPASSRFV